ncbi:MAG: hypothetical protein K2O81_06885 [Clostridia bacterium]|nr:hypothetical protein [Clostridia bacterium]
MIKFDDGKITESVRRKRILNGLNLVFFTVILIEALIVAALSRNAASNWGLYIALYVQLGAFVLLYVMYLAMFFAKGGRQLKYSVSKAIADGMLEREAMFGGGGDIEFSADYSGNTLTLSRKGYTGEITINPSRLKSAQGLSGAGSKIELDLTPLKAVPSVYATVGSRLWQFLQAYYFLHGEKNGVQNVTVTDNTGKTPFTLQVFQSGVTAKNAENNYFIKKGLVK